MYRNQAGTSSGKQTNPGDKATNTSETPSNKMSVDRLKNPDPKIPAVSKTKTPSNNKKKEG